MDIYYTAIGFKKNVTENGEQRTENREQIEIPIAEATLIPMDHWV